MSLPSMRTIDSMPQQAGGLPSPHHAMPMNMPVPMPPGPVAGGGMSFYPHHQPSISPSYGFPDAMPRYAMPHDPRLLGSRGPKKVRNIPRQDNGWFGCTLYTAGFFHMVEVLVLGFLLIYPL